jgi:hypothetical protein
MSRLTRVLSSAPTLLWLLATGFALGCLLALG